MKFITFSGVDGSGKSTQLALLREKLERENWNVAYFHAIQFSVASRLKKQLTGNNKPGGEPAVTQASWFTIFLRKIFLIIDLIRFRFYYNRLKREHCDYLLSDRYFYDTIINIEYLQTGRELSFIFSILYSLFSIHPQKAFYLDIAPETIMSRERAPEQGIEYLRAKMGLFKQKISEWNLIIIDADKDKETVFDSVLKALR